MASALRGAQDMIDVDLIEADTYPTATRA